MFYLQANIYNFYNTFIHISLDLILAIDQLTKGTSSQTQTLHINVEKETYQRPLLTPSRA